MSGPTTRISPLRLGGLAATGAGLTHRGLVRTRNEDAILLDPSGALWAVADGMGGHGHGDVAADLVIDELARIAEGGDAARSLRDGLLRADARVKARAAEIGAPMMGATVVALLIDGGAAHLAWAGDSRAYLASSRDVRPLTRDHSLVREMVDRGEIAEAEAGRHPARNVVTRAVGGDGMLEPETMRVGMAAGDRLLLCSDGLTACLSDADIAEALGRDVAADALCRDLVDQCLDAGAPDNVSVIIIDVRNAGRA